ncbi:serine hydrolase domain-containing protein [Maricaulis sp.]|uniref:serine hydrolase domain-containing protein n=1 Tax=Maricaulis sp. TaxID=1486257 RepID=UPI0026021F54|nr:serine hydrolase domain-containing protein [Maricaulis sp.]
MLLRLGTVLASALLLANCSPASTADLPAETTAPVAIQPVLNLQPLGALEAQLSALVESGARPGYAVMVAVGEQVFHTSEVGLVDIEAGLPMTVDSPIRIASMTKPVTALATMMLVETGQIGLDDPVSQYIPSFADVRVAVSPMANEAGEIETRAPAGPITIRQLLTHTAGVGYIFEAETDLGRLYLENSLYSGDGDLAARMDRLAELPLYVDPGDRWIYSYSNDVLGRVIEVASGETLADFMENRIFTPLAMHNTGFFFDDVAFDEADMPPLYIHDETGAMTVFDQPNPDWASGGGGLVSTASDYIRFAMMLANGGALGDVRLISEASLQEMMSPQVSREQLGEGWEGASYGYGFAVVIPPAEGEQPQGIPGDVSWGGYFDTDFVVIPSQRISAVIMTQIQPGPHRPEPRSSAVFRPYLYQSVTAAQPE